MSMIRATTCRFRAGVESHVIKDRKHKPKSAAEARKSHLALQARRDALARIRNGETVEVRLSNGDKVKARALGKDEWPAHLLCLAIINRRLRAEWCSDKNALRVGTRYVSTADILGVVIYVNGKDPYAHYPGNLYLRALKPPVKTPSVAESRTSRIVVHVEVMC
jgi:hypothetical protein